MRTFRAVVKGRVQGLGFRPYVYKFAVSMHVAGYVANTNQGVEIIAQGRRAREFLTRLSKRPPPLARMTSFVVSRVDAPPVARFEIRTSTSSGSAGIEVLPDLATCPDCRMELADCKDRRYGYPFTNCTQCGPRYTIIESLPYDRPRTTMRAFRMCPDCAREYNSPADRRFHAQPNACPACGPALSLLKLPHCLTASLSHCLTVSGPIPHAAAAVAAGRTVAIKSLGGFQLACDATSTKAIGRLRRRKKRPAKPFALMCDSLPTARQFCRVSPAEAMLLASSAAPILLLARRSYPQLTISQLVAPGNARYGVMLPYTPLHLLLFAELRKLTGKPVVLVMTSANRKDAPITATDEELLSELGEVVDLVLTHDRPIANRCDDSVVMAIPAGRTGRTDRVLPVRIARGYAPPAIPLGPMFHVKHPILGVGGDTRNCFCLAAADRAFVSPHIGDLGSVRADRFFMETLERLLAWTGISPERIACDLHPDYFSTRLAERLAGKWHVPLVRVQHHLAHTVSAIAEHGTSERVLGLALDGTGYGTDGATWGCELLLVEPDLSWQRVGHLGYLRLPAAGDAVPDPKRIAAAYLVQARTGTGPIGHTGHMTSSLGRLFDAVAGLTGICRKASFDGQAAIALEAAADRYLMNGRRGSRAATLSAGLGIPPVSWSKDTAIIEPAPIIRQVMNDLGSGKCPEAAAARFHMTVSRALVAATLGLARMHRVKVVAMSGGAVQNSLLRNSVCSDLLRHGIRVVYNQAVPVNDGGICLGQAVAAGRR